MLNTNVSIYAASAILFITLLFYAAITDMLPTILNQLPTESLAHLKERIVGASAGAQGGAAVAAPAAEEDDEVPELVENFDEPSKKEAPTVETKAAEEVKPAEEAAPAEAAPAEAAPAEAAPAAAPEASEPVKAAEAPTTEE